MKGKDDEGLQPYNEINQISTFNTSRPENDLDNENDVTRDEDFKDEELNYSHDLSQNLRKSLDRDYLKQNQLKQLESQAYRSVSLQNNPNDFLKECLEYYTENPTPRKLGYFTCFWYSSTGQPKIVIGPDWIFSLVELIVINGIAGYFVFSTDRFKHPYMFLIGLLVLAFQDLSFLILVMQNPGLPSRDPSIHSESYLNKVRILRPHLYCNICKVIYRQETETEHCTTCGFCIEELDHHCPWSSKCIGSGNMLMFKVFLFMTVSLMVYLFSGGMFSMQYILQLHNLILVLKLDKTL
ncbi:dhhc zinc finger domain containing protein [Stylonychia lemnae]|uniref:Palmitoyltransferase n=1 Tax=Stylonychia lemnae TaxID=5949 RepID=A0A077ZUI4_STYLE|nr:dhhc zinc finger domain containing protein [Stylonychia lemnae]|eukprot:CDW72131.1 dhhc zinc finger domain containing protein [Stylonychia lemnae]